MSWRKSETPDFQLRWGSRARRAEDNAESLKKKTGKLNMSLIYLIPSYLQHFINTAHQVGI